MKLWLQVLFTQGWLWRHGFPERFAAARTPRLGWLWWLLLFWVPAVWAIAALDLADDQENLSALAIANAFAWLAWQSTLLAIGPHIGGKELWISLHWAAGCAAYVLVLLSLVVGIVAWQWPWVLWSGIVLTCSASRWLRGAECNYLVFRDPVGNAPSMEPSAPEKGFISPVVRIVTDAYWRLPKQILFPQKERHVR